MTPPELLKLQKKISKYRQQFAKYNVVYDTSTEPDTTDADAMRHYIAAKDKELTRARNRHGQAQWRDRQRQQPPQPQPRQREPQQQDAQQPSADDFLLYLRGQNFEHDGVVLTDEVINDITRRDEVLRAAQETARQKSLQFCAGGCGRFCGNAHRCVADATSTYFAVLILAATRVLARGISAPTASCPQAVLLPRLPCSNGAFAGCGRLKTHCYTSRASTCTRRPRLGTSPGNGASSPSDSPMRSPSIRRGANPSLGSPFGSRDPVSRTVNFMSLLRVAAIQTISIFSSNRLSKESRRAR